MADFEDEIVKKKSVITEECELMLREAAKWIKENYLACMMKKSFIFA